jgi:mono/diheme cytochrome c family protein
MKRVTVAGMTLAIGLGALLVPAQQTPPPPAPPATVNRPPLPPMPPVVIRPTPPPVVNQSTPPPPVVYQPTPPPANQPQAFPTFPPPLTPPAQPAAAPGAGPVLPPAPITPGPVLPPHPVQAGGGPMPGGILAWNTELKEIKTQVGAPHPEFFFTFTNVSPNDVTITHVQPSCGCTTLQLPPMPWRVAPGTNGQIPVKMTLNPFPTTLFKTITVHTDKGSKLLNVKAIVEAAPPVQMTEEQRKKNQELVKADPQAIFKGECVTCHVQPAVGKFGGELYKAACGICHEAEHRASIVPDLHKLPHETNADFWKAIVENGKPGSLMPAFSQAKGGPLSDVQIKTLVDYLVATMPAKPTPTNSTVVAPAPSKPDAPHAGK